MKTYPLSLLILCALIALAAVVLLLKAPTAIGGPAPAVFSPEGVSQPRDALSPNRIQASAPVIFPPDPDWPAYARREITVHPEPPILDQPTEICAWVTNTTGITTTVMLDLGVASFGMGLSFASIGTRTVLVPPYSKAQACVVWIPRQSGHWCIQAILHQDGSPDQQIQRNLDIGESLQPGIPTLTVFPVRNPDFTQADSIEMRLLNVKPGWVVTITPSLLAGMAPDETRPVTLSVQPPSVGGPLGSRQPIVDVEAWSNGGLGTLIGGFRKMDWPLAPLHRPKDPSYAETGISVDPYPPLSGEPTRICVELHNLSTVPQTMDVDFEVTNFGIGLPFTSIGQRTATIPPVGKTQVCVTWIPPVSGHFCVQVILDDPQQRYARQQSQRNMDVSEILKPGIPSLLLFPVGNPTSSTVTVTLGTVLHLAGWDVYLSQNELPDMAPGQTRVVTLTVTPPQGAPAPPDGTPIVDVEGFTGGELLGGFRKVYRPPAPIHRPGDPIYAESEIFVDPYPTRIGAPTLLGVVVFNPTPETQRITVTFGVAPPGIGLPFTTTGIITPQMALTIPPFGAARARTTWIPYFNGHLCVQVTLQSAGHAPVWSQRNIDVGEPLQLGVPHSRIIEVRNPLAQAVTITLGLVNYRPGWMAEVTPTVLTNMAPRAVRPITLTVTPAQPSSDPQERELQLRGLADGEPIVDVEAYVEGELLGGIRKIARPPIPLHKPQDKPYAETEISVTPYPVQAGKPHTLTAEIVNTSELTYTIRVMFGVANFGFGVPFTNANIVPTSTMVVLGPGLSQTVSAMWMPPSAGHWCVQVILQDPSDQYYPPQKSQRNVDVERRSYLPCQPFTKDFLLQNSTPSMATVSIGASTINLPAGWTYSSSITQTVLGSYQSISVTVTITPPCGMATQGLRTLMNSLDAGGAGDPPTINVEGYVNGELLGGVQIQLESAASPATPILLAPPNGAVTTTQAITLVWEAGAGAAPIGYNVWLDGAIITTTDTTSPTILSTGIHTWTVRAYNDAGYSDWATFRTLQVYGQSEVIPLTNVSISGPTTGTINTTYTFTASVEPIIATTPITYAWSPAPVSGQGTASARYQWATPGVYTITLVAENAGNTVSDTHTIIISTQPSTGDYEPNDTCAQANLISTDGTEQIHSFYKQADVDWVAFYATAGITYVIEARVPPSSTADVVLELYDSCSASGSFDDSDPVFSPDIRFTFRPNASRLYYVRLTNYYTNTFGPDVVYYLSIRALQDAVPSGAIILVGGRLRPDDRLQANIHHVTDALYRFARTHGCSDDQIRYLATDTNLVGVDDTPTTNHLRDAITQWAVGHVSPDHPLTLYLVNHGNYDRFYLDGPGEAITPLDLDGWLDQLEQAVPGVQVNVIVEACRSGSFIDPDKRVSKEGRTVIASTSPQAVAYASEEGALFSDAFLNGLQQGLSLRAAFEEGAWAVGQAHPDQVPWLDGDGDGLPDPAHAGQVAAQRGLACEAVPPQTNWPPNVTQVEVRNLKDNQGEIWSRALDDQQVKWMYAVIYPPSWKPPASSEEMITGTLPVYLPALGNGWYGIAYNFKEIGMYRIVIYAVDDAGLEARPKEIQVRTGWQVYLPMVVKGQ